MRRRSSPLFLVPLVMMLSAACRESRSDEPRLPDAGGPDAGEDAAAPLPPWLDAPGQVVPLLYGRTVRAQSLRDGLRRESIVRLDDPSQPEHRALMGDLDAACRAQVSASQVRAPGAGISIPGCGREGVFEARLHLCRAEFGLWFAATDHVGGIAMEPDGPRIARDDPGELRWSLGQGDTFTRASWAMLAVASQRAGIAVLARALDPEGCPRGLAEAARDGETETLGEVAVASLLELSASLDGTTRLADGLLRARMLETNDAPTGDRVRALNDSMLERMKLFVPVPYGAFDAPDGREGSYPLPVPAPTGAVADAVWLMRATGADVLDDARAPRDAEHVASALFDALRGAEPLALGSLSHDAAGTLWSALGLDGASLSAAAAWSSADSLSRGTPLAREPAVGGSRLWGLRDEDAATTPGWAASATEAMATLSDEAADYGQRGLAHALELASRTARAAVERDDLGSAADRLPRVPRAHGRLRWCAGEDGELSVRVLDVAADVLGSLRLVRGEDDAFCAGQATLAGLPCVDSGGLAPALDDPDAHFRLRPEPGASPRAYLIGPDERGQGRAVLAALSLAPFERAPGECAEQPLSATAQRELTALHEDDLEGALARRTPRVASQIAIPIADTMPVPLTAGRSIAYTGTGQSSFELAMSFDPARLELEHALLLACDDPPLTEPGCDPSSFRSAARLGCLANGVARLAAQDGGAVGERLVEPGQATALTLWAYELRGRELAELTLSLDALACDGPAGERLEAQAWERIAARLDAVLVLYESTRQALAAELREENDVQAVRGARGSRLASARQLVAVPARDFEPSEPDADSLDGALWRFPVVSRPAARAEDTRIEALLRQAELHPLAPDLTLRDGELDADAFDRVLSSGTLVTLLRARLAALDAERYGASPATAGGFLAWLGVTHAQFTDAVLRIVQRAESRGVSLLPRPDTSPVLARGLTARSAVRDPLHLYALTEGRVGEPVDALPDHRFARSHFHLLEQMARLLESRRDRALHGTADERAARDAVVAALRQQVPEVSPELVQSRDQSGSPRFSLELSVPRALDDATLRARYGLVWTDTGLACALLGPHADEACAAEDFTLDESEVVIEDLVPRRLGERRVLLSGYGLPRAPTWDVAQSREVTHGRVYLVERGTAARALLAATLDPELSSPVRFHAPASASAWRAQLLDLLAFRDPAEGCGACSPLSVCEVTYCELGRCVREPVPDGAACGHATCDAGVCTTPGCGDGARADGSDEVPYEACDDGNLLDGDGCSAVCTTERRSIDALVREAYTAGPAPAIAVDGLGNALVVYRRDALALGDDNAPILAQRFDAFGVAEGLPITVEANAPRGLRADPTAVGLRDGGFAIVYVGLEVEGAQRLGYRLLDEEGLGPVRAVSSPSGIQFEARVAALDDGFAVAFSERAAATNAVRLRLRRFDAHGDAYLPATDVAPSSTGGDQRHVALASSQGQLLVVWDELSDAGQPVRMRRFDALGGAADPAAVTIAVGPAGRPSASTLGTGDYQVAYQRRSVDGSWDIESRVVRRFGAPLEGSPPVLLAQTERDETAPAVAGSGSAGFVATWQDAGATILLAPELDAETDALVRAELARSEAGDVSLTPSRQGVWLAFSARTDQARALYVMLLPHVAAAVPSPLP